MIYRGNKGFTLIELLIVVLIIGILAAIALPQYQYAVKKSQLTALFPLLDNLVRQEEAWRLVSGAYTVDLTQLDLPSGGTISAFSSNPRGRVTYPNNYTCYTPGGESMYCEYKMVANVTLEQYVSSPAVYTQFAGKKICWALNNDAQAVKFCNRITGKASADYSDSGRKGYTFYTINN